MRIRPAAKSDLTTASLPHNRREVFSDICALYGGMLFKLGLILIAFAAPCLFIAFLADQNQIAYLAEALAAEDTAPIWQEYQITDSLFNLLNILGLLLFSVGLAGTARVIRQHAWEEPVNLKLDFLKGIRQNCRPFWMLAFLAGCWIFLTKYCFAGALYATGGGVVLNLIPLLIGLLVLLPILCYTAVATTIYTNPLRRNLQLGMLLFLKRPLPAMGICLLLPLLILAAEAIPAIPIRLLLRLMNLLLLPFLLLGWTLWSMNQMDKHINAKQYPELVGKGFTPLETDETQTESN